MSWEIEDTNKRLSRLVTGHEKRYGRLVNLERWKWVMGTLVVEEKGEKEAKQPKTP